MVHVVHHVLRLTEQDADQFLLPNRALLYDGALQSVRVHVEEVHGHHRLLHLNVIRDDRVPADVRVERVRGWLQLLVPGRGLLALLATGSDINGIS